jgi:hypothetical protein
LGVEGDAGQASVAGLAQTANAFGPAEDSLNSASDVLAAAISFGAQRAAIESGKPGPNMK